MGLGYATAAAVSMPSVPSAPGGLTAAALAGGASLSWSVAPANGSPLVGYVLEYGDVLQSLAATATAAVVGNLLVATEHAFTLRASNAVGLGAAATAFASLAAAAPPQSLRAAVIDGGGNGGDITLQWQPPQTLNGASVVLGYLVSWSKAGGGGGAGVTTVAGSATAAFVDVGADRFEPYIFVVRASNAAGLGLAATATATPVGAPARGAAIEIVGHSAENLLVTLRLRYDITTTPIDRYNLFVRYGNRPDLNSDTNRVLLTVMRISVTAAANGVVSPTDVVISNLIQGTNYAFLVVGANAAGSHSGPFNQVTLYSPFRPPLSVTVLRGANHTNGRISLSWQPPASNDSGAHSGLLGVLEQG